MYGTETTFGTSMPKDFYEKVDPVYPGELKRIYENPTGKVTPALLELSRHPGEIIPLIRVNDSGPVTDLFVKTQSGELVRTGSIYRPTNGIEGIEKKPRERVKAEGLVVLSGNLAGLVQGKYARNAEGWEEMKNSSLRYEEIRWQFKQFAWKELAKHNDFAVFQDVTDDPNLFMFLANLGFEVVFQTNATDKENQKTNHEPDSGLLVLRNHNRLEAALIETNTIPNVQDQGLSGEYNGPANQGIMYGEGRGSSIAKHLFVGQCLALTYQMGDYIFQIGNLYNADSSSEGERLRTALNIADRFKEILRKHKSIASQFLALVAGDWNIFGIDTNTKLFGKLNPFPFKLAVKNLAPNTVLGQNVENLRELMELASKLKSKSFKILNIPKNDLPEPTMEVPLPLVGKLPKGVTGGRGKLGFVLDLAMTLASGGGSFRLIRTKLSDHNFVEFVTGLTHDPELEDEEYNNSVEMGVKGVKELKKALMQIAGAAITGGLGGAVLSMRRWRNSEK